MDEEVSNILKHRCFSHDRRILQKKKKSSFVFGLASKNTEQSKTNWILSLTDLVRIIVYHWIEKLIDHFLTIFLQIN